jgi:hypothetical protein
LFADSWFIIQNSGDGADGDTSLAGNLANGNQSILALRSTVFTKLVFLKAKIPLFLAFVKFCILGNLPAPARWGIISQA